MIDDAFEFGRNLGLAFQLIDDLLDYMSTSSVLGKPTVNDLKQGKRAISGVKNATFGVKKRHLSSKWDILT